MSAEQISGLMKLAPANIQLIEVQAPVGTEGLSLAIEQSLFGKLPEESWSPPEIPDRTRPEGNQNEHSRAQRYSRLDSRFDVDIDDQQAPQKKSEHKHAFEEKMTDKPVASDFGKRLGSILSSVSTTSYCELARSKAETGKPFVRFERAIITPLKSEAVVNREALEGAIVEELRTRFVVAGTQPRLEWRDESSVRYVAQSLLEQGAAYAVLGSYLVMASSRELANDIVQAARSASSISDRSDTPADFYALIRVAAAKPAFDTLMSKLDGRGPRKTKRAADDEDAPEVKFFSENLSSLIAASGIREVRVTRQTAGPVATERVVYVW
jgi:hypothetical protein